MDYWRKVFTTRFNVLKNEQGLTQEKLAEKIGVTQGTVGHWLRGERTPGSMEVFRKIESALTLAPGQLTQPEPSNNELPVLATENETPYSPTLDADAVEKATAFLIEQIGVDGIEKQGAAWTAKTIIFLYDLFSDPESARLKEATIIRMIGKIE